MTKSKAIFISYRREDSPGYAGRLHDRLTAHFKRDQIFMDIDDIEPGLDFVEVIETAVGACDILLAVIGRQWLSVADARGRRRLDNPEDFVRLEIAVALERNIRVIPVLVHGATMPGSADLPPALSKLARRNAIELTDRSWHQDTERLIKALERALAAPATPAAAAVTSPPQPDARQPAPPEPAAAKTGPAARPAEETPFAPRRFRSADAELPVAVGEGERDLHIKARRFARLLVSEIKLYNEAKVKEGRERGDLYGILRDEIDRSRLMYDKFIDPSVAPRYDYFHHALASTLAEGDVRKMGRNYPGEKLSAKPSS